MKKQLLKNIKEEVEQITNNEYSVTNERYIQTTTKNRREIEVLHKNCGNKYWTTTFKFLKQKTRCLYCSTSRPFYNTEIFKNKVKELSNGTYEILGEYKNTHTKIDLLHKICGKVYAVTPSHFISDGTRCPFCKNEGLKTKNYSNKLNKLGKNNFVLLSEYINYHSDILVRHKICGKSFITKPVNLKRQYDDFNEIYCQVCQTRLFHGEENLKEILEEMNIIFKRQYSDARCRNKRPLKFDFAIFNKIGELKGLIEFDGYQHKHKKSIYSKGKKFKETQLRDKIKNEFSQKENIHLLRINYWNVKKEKMKSIVKEFIKNLEL